MIFSVKETYYNAKLAAADSKSMYRIIKTLLNNGGKVLPVCNNYENLSNSFADLKKKQNYEDKTVI